MSRQPVPLIFAPSPLLRRSTSSTCGLHTRVRAWRAWMVPAPPLVLVGAARVGLWQRLWLLRQSAGLWMKAQGACLKPNVWLCCRMRQEVDAPPQANLHLLPAVAVCFICAIAWKYALRRVSARATPKLV